jgi:hypothetical protein
LNFGNGNFAGFDPGEQGLDEVLVDGVFLNGHKAGINAGLQWLGLQIN